MNNFEKTSLLIQERTDLRKEIIEFEKTQYKIVFSSIVIAGSFIGLIFTKELFNEPTIRGILLLFLFQIEYFLILFNFILMRNMGVHSEYIKAIEDKINLLSGEKINIWESHICKQFLYKPKSSSFWIAALFCLFALGVFTLFIVTINSIFKSIYLVSFLIIEVLIAIIILIYLQIAKSNVYDYAKNIFKIENNDANKQFVRKGDMVMDTDQAREGYRAAIQLISHDAKNIWDSFRSLLTVNSIFVGFIGVIIKLYDKYRLLAIILESLGIIVCFIWILITARNFSYYRYWFYWAQEYEKIALGSENSLIQVGKQFSKGSSIAIESKEAIRMNRLSRLIKVEYLLYLIIVVFIIIYVFLIIKN